MIYLLQIFGRLYFNISNTELKYSHSSSTMESNIYYKQQLDAILNNIEWTIISQDKMIRKASMVFELNRHFWYMLNSQW